MLKYVTCTLLLINPFYALQAHAEPSQLANNDALSLSTYDVEYQHLSASDDRIYGGFKFCAFHTSDDRGVQQREFLAAFIGYRQYLTRDRVLQFIDY